MNLSNHMFLKKRNCLSILVILSILLQVFFCLGLTNDSESLFKTEIIICKDTNNQTTTYFYSSEQEGPTVMIMAGVHGDELAGIEALKQYMEDIKLERGTVIIIPEANKEAIEHRVRALSPEEDLNRNYPGDPASEGIERLAGEIFKIMKNNEIDFLLDLHESADYYNKNSSFYGQTIVLDDNSNFLQEIANYLVNKLNSSIVSPEAMLDVIVKPIAGSSTYEALNLLEICGVTFETCNKMDYKKRVDFHYQCIENVLAYFDVINLPIEGKVEND
ncbi:MAG: succinylglutamate desuccinylase/aspartoacylase family protein [Atribacterota bacterium]